MSEYPKALQEFLNREDLPDGYKEMFDKMAQTDAGKEIIAGAQNLKFVEVDYNIKGEDGSALPDKNGVQKLRLGSSFGKEGAASPEKFAFVTMHELRHLNQIDNGGMEAGEKYGESANMIRETGADFKAWQAYNQVNSDKNSSGYIELHQYLLNGERKYSKKSIENVDYEGMKQSSSIEKDIEIQSELDMPEKELKEKIASKYGQKHVEMLYPRYRAQVPDCYSGLSSKEMLKYEKKIGEGKAQMVPIEQQLSIYGINQEELDSMISSNPKLKEMFNGRELTDKDYDKATSILEKQGLLKQHAREMDIRPGDPRLKKNENTEVAKRARERLKNKKNGSVRNRRNRLNHFKQTGSVYNPNKDKNVTFDMEAYKKMQDNKSRSE